MGLDEASFIIEYGHIYLEEIESGSTPNKKTDYQKLKKATELLDEYGIDYDLMTIVDDTSIKYNNSFGTKEFNRFKKRHAERYLQNLPVEPDRWYFESEFGEVLGKLCSQIPCIDLPELGKPDGWGLYFNKNKSAIYIYGKNQPNEEKPKMKVADFSKTSNKSTAYTCAAYVTAMTVSKFGLVESSIQLPNYTNAISFHSDKFFKSKPYRKAHTFQKILYNHDIISFKSYSHPEHIQVGPNDDFEKIRDQIRRKFN